MVDKIRKRDGKIVPFNLDKIRIATFQAMTASKEGGVDLENDPSAIAQNVLRDLEKRGKAWGDGYTPGIEEIQDLVQINLARRSYKDTAIKYMLYRDQRTQKREQRKAIPKRVKDFVNKSKKYFRSPLGEFISYRSYSRWMDEEGRRETWVESVGRYMNFMKKNLEGRLTEEEYGRIEDAILKQKVVPSMRLMWSAGKAAEATNVAAYNCSYLTPTRLKDFGEIMYISMCTAGVGFSVENQFVHQLPIVQKQKGIKKPTHVINDSKEGWADALVKGLETWSEGYDIGFDYSKIRPAGDRLKTMGGRSSGPDILKVLLNYSRDLFLDKENQGRRLKSIDVHDLACKIGEVVVAGGVRRSALISLSDLEDTSMRYAKAGEFWTRHPERQLANNSAVYEEKPSSIGFMREWLALAESGNGERGIFNRGGLKLQLPERRLIVIGDQIFIMGVNPCGEIYLISRQFCNLSGIVARANDTRAALRENIEIATILGTYQSMLTNFPYIDSAWKENSERERLLGVSITGFMDSPIVQRPEVLRDLKKHAIEANEYYAKKFGINPSNAVTCVKPSGNSSELVNSSSGAHPRWSEYYIRNVEISAGDPLFHMLREQGYPYFPKIGQSMGSATTYVLPFPVKSPKNSVSRKDLGAIEQLENWKNLKGNFTEHNPSVSIYVGEDEWVRTGNWIYENWDIVGGLAFFPRDDHSYTLAPFEEIDERRYHEMVSRLPKIDFSRLSHYEEEDQTTGAKEYACMSGKCDLI